MVFLSMGRYFIYSLDAIIISFFPDIEYLYRSTIWDHMGTKELGSSEISLAKTFMSVFLIYIVIDTTWIAAKPT